MEASINKYLRIILITTLLFSITFIFIQPVVAEESETDVTPPEVQTFDPSNGESDVNVDHDVLVTFNEDMDTSVTPTLTFLQGTDPGYTLFTWNDNRNAAWSFNQWSPNELIDIQISNYLDEAGNSGAIGSWSFTIESDILVEFFYAEDCGHCEEKEPVIDAIEEYYGDNITVLRLPVNVYENKQRYVLYFKNTPGVVVTNQSSGNESVFPYINITEENLKNIIDYHLIGNYTQKPPETDPNKLIDTPFGKINLSDLSLPVITIILGALDSVNPCSFFILLFLLNLLLYVKSRKRMFIIGGIFIFFSGFIYFLLMALLLTTFNVIEQPLIVTMIAGLIAIVLGFVNIKDYFFFKKGFSLSISDDKKQKLFKRMRSVVKIKHLPTMIIATIVLAIFANTYELACTLALPVVYNNFLTNVYDVPIMQSYLYLILYNAIYVIPLITIVLIFVVTLGRRKLSEFQGRMLKLGSGLMMFSFGLVMLISPSLLKNVFAAVGILFICLIMTVIVFGLERYSSNIR